MQLVIAALKTLSPALKDSACSELNQEFAHCQQELLHQERLLAGRASYFRTAAATAAAEQFRDAYSTGADRDAAPDRQIENQINRAVGHYLRGDLSAAIRALDSDRPEALYAVACLSLESSQPDACATVLRRLTPESHPTPIQILALHLIKTVAPASDSR